MGKYWQLLRETQMLVQFCSFATLASMRKEQGRQRPFTHHDVYLQMTESGKLAFQVHPSASWLQDPNDSACCTRRGAYAAGPVVVRAILRGEDQ